MKTKEQAIANIRLAIPHFRYAMSMAKANGTAKIGILSVGPSGGKVEMSFEADEFFDDLALALDIPAQTEDDDMEAKAERLVQMIRPRNG